MPPGLVGSRYPASAFAGYRFPARGDCRGRALVPAVWHGLSYRDVEELLAERGVEVDHGRLKARLGPMPGLKCDRTAAVVIRGHAFVQNVRRGHYELGVDARSSHLRLAAALDELADML